MYVYKELVGKATVVRTRQSNTLRPIWKIHYQRVTTLYIEAARYDFNTLLHYHKLPICRVGGRGIKHFI